MKTRRSRRRAFMSFRMSLVSGGVRRAAACLLAAALALTLGAGAAQAQSTAPQISSVAFTSTPSIDTDDDGIADTYGLGDTIEVTVTWDKDVTWDVSAHAQSFIALRLVVGSGDRLPFLVTNGATSGTARSLVFRYAVLDADTDNDGVATMAATSTSSLVVLFNLATLLGSGGLAADLGFSRPSQAAGSNHKVNSKLV